MSLQVHPELPVRLRRVRDSGALLFMFAFLGFLGYVIWDGLYIKQTDINLIVHGHDSYGNICGRNNKPIKFSDRSGQNYTSKAYTKYTLINAQYERYTLATSRLKNGELIYVKATKTGEGGVDGGIASDDEHQELRLAAAAASDGRTQTSLTDVSEQLLSHASRVKQPSQATGTHARGGPFVAPIDGGPPPHYERLAANTQTDGPKLDSNGNIATFARGNNKIFNTANGNTTSSTTRRQPPQRQRRLADGVGTALNFDLVELARTNRSLLNALRTNMMYQYPPMYGYSAQAQQMQQNNSLTAANMKKIATNSQISKSLGDTSTVAANTSHPKSLINVSPPSSNDSERFEHTFVTPISVTTTYGTGRTIHNSLNPPIHGITQSEVANQLLYLTECVAVCPPDHVELIFYRCMPNNWRFSLFPNAINVTRTFIDDIITDVTHCYRELIYTFSLALVLSLSLLILLRFLASIIIWSCLVLLILLFLSMAGYSWLTFYNHLMDLEQIMPHDSIYAERIASSDKWLIGSIFLTFVAFATIGTVLFMRKRILLVTTLFRESGKAIADMPLLLLQPLMTFTALVAIMIAWLAGLVCLQSMKSPVVDMHTSFVVYRADTLYKIMKWYHIFAFLWVSHFAIACQHYVIGASVSKWYFSSNRYELSSPIGTSISELILYYLGSVALGSFLVAIFKVIRVIIRQIQFLVQRSCMSPPLNANQALDGGGPPGQQGSSASSSCGSLGYVWRLFIWFFDNIVMIINRDAYVEIAIHGHSFLGGARRAFTVLASNPLRLLAIKSVGNILLVIAKICVVVGTVSMAYILLEGKSHQLNYSWSPIVISAIYAYIVAHWFLSVYEMVIDALFICYCEDYEQKNSELNRAINGSNFRSQILSNGQIY